MKILKINLFLIAGLALLLSCEKNKMNSLPDDDYLVFGQFYGHCQGEQCIEIFKLNSNSLLEDTTDEYPSRETFYQGAYVELSRDMFEEAAGLMKFFPSELLSEDQTVFGCPDCADQGGMYVEYKRDGVHRFWLIDNNKDYVPGYLHDFMEEAEQRIAVLKQN